MFHISDELLEKYAIIGPRYTSYPTAPMWHEIDRETHQAWLKANSDNEQAVSLYIHIPFCRDRCLYCGCNVTITRQQSASGDYIPYLLNEIDAQADSRTGNKTVKQLHFGGGTPNFLLDEEFQSIMDRLRKRFEFVDDTEIGIEIDPCSTGLQQLEFLADLGINRLSLGVQDLDAKVQNAVQRVQSAEVTLEHLETARKIGIKGINFDLIYGLPFQTVESFARTVDRVLDMKPDRLAVYNFGYLPERMIHQRKIKPETLPSPKTKMTILLDSINRFCEAGYNYIGMDHFSLPEDELSIAQENRTLHRNFMGYTPKSGVDLLGIGVTSISEFNGHFIQNAHKLKTYKQQISESNLSGSRGIELSDDDRMRKWTILKLICHFYLDFKEFYESFGVNFQDYFKEEIKQLNGLIDDGLLTLDTKSIRVIDHGKILVRNICMVFDAYLKREDKPRVKFSQTI